MPAGKHPLAFLGKKSWHTKNIKNVEKVWIAEQKEEAERKKLADLQKQIMEERQIDELQRAIDAWEDNLARNKAVRQDASNGLLDPIQKMWGQESIDLLQNRHILPAGRVEAQLRLELTQLFQSQSSRPSRDCRPR